MQKCSLLSLALKDNRKNTQEVCQRPTFRLFVHQGIRRQRLIAVTLLHCDVFFENKGKDSTKGGEKKKKKKLGGKKRGKKTVIAVCRPSLLTHGSKSKKGPKTTITKLCS